MGGSGGWAMVGLAAASVASATPEAAKPRRLPAAQPELAQAYPQPISPQPTYAQPVYTVPQPSPWEQYKTYLGARARSAGVRPATVQAVMPYLRFNQRVVELDRDQRPPSTNTSYPPAFGPYLERHITTSLINRGQARYYDRYSQLKAIEARYGVDPWSRHGPLFDGCVTDGLMWHEEPRFGLTRRGMLVANEILAAVV